MKKEINWFERNKGIIFGIIIILSLAPFVGHEYKKVFFSSPIQNSITTEAVLLKSKKNLNEFMKIYYKDQADRLDKWLSLTAIFLTGLGLLGLLGYWRFIDDAKKKLKEIEVVGDNKVMEIKKKLVEMTEKVENMEKELDKKIEEVKSNAITSIKLKKEMWG